MFNNRRTVIQTDPQGLTSFLGKKAKEHNQIRSNNRISVDGNNSLMIISMGNQSASIARMSLLPLVFIRPSEINKSEYNVCIRPSIFGTVGFLVIAAACVALIVQSIKQQDYSGIIVPTLLLLSVAISTLYYARKAVLTPCKPGQNLQNKLGHLNLQEHVQEKKNIQPRRALVDPSGSTTRRTRRDTAQV